MANKAQTKGGVAKKGVKPFANKQTMNSSDKARVDRDASQKAKANRKK